MEENFEIEEELGLPKGGPTLDDGMDDIYGQQGEGGEPQVAPVEEDAEMAQAPQQELPPAAVEQQVQQAGGVSQLDESQAQAQEDPAPQSLDPEAAATAATAAAPVPSQPATASQPAAAEAGAPGAELQGAATVDGPKAGSDAGSQPQQQPTQPQQQPQQQAPVQPPPGQQQQQPQQSEAPPLTQQERDAINLQDAQESHQKVYLANMTWWTTDAEIEGLCSEFGKLASLEFVTDRSNGKSKGCVLVEFTTAEAAVQCKEQLQGHVMHGRPIITTFQRSGPGVKMGPPYNVNTAEGVAASQGRGRGPFTGGARAGGFGDMDGSGRERFGGGGNWRGRGRNMQGQGMAGRGAAAGAMPAIPPAMMMPGMMPPIPPMMMPGLMMPSITGVPGVPFTGMPPL